MHCIDVREQRRCPVSAGQDVEPEAPKTVIVTTIARIPFHGYLEVDLGDVSGRSRADLIMTAEAIGERFYADVLKLMESYGKGSIGLTDPTNCDTVDLWQERERLRP